MLSIQQGLPFLVKLQVTASIVWHMTSNVHQNCRIFHFFTFLLFLEDKFFSFFAVAISRILKTMRNFSIIAQDCHKLCNNCEIPAPFLFNEIAGFYYD